MGFAALSFFGKNFLLARSSLVQVLVLSNRSMINLSILFIASSPISFGLSGKVNSASVSSGSDFHVDPAKPDTVSQPVKAWNIGMTRDISGSRVTAIWWAAR